MNVTTVKNGQYDGQMKNRITDKLAYMRRTEGNTRCGPKINEDVMIELNLEPMPQ